jgi:GNAT superfamily N-acetyltransferase
MQLPRGHQLFVDHPASPADVDGLGWNLDAYNRTFLGAMNYAEITLFVRDESQTVRAGIAGEAYAGWLFIKLLWVHADLRRAGIGSGLLAEAERRAALHGCEWAWVDTFSFQAPGFYAKFGYREFGRLDYPPDHQRIFLKKQLTAE